MQFFFHITLMRIWVNNAQNLNGTKNKNKKPFLYAYLDFWGEISPLHEIHTISYKKKKAKLILRSYWTAAGMWSNVDRFCSHSWCFTTVTITRLMLQSHFKSFKINILVTNFKLLSCLKLIVIGFFIYLFFYWVFQSSILLNTSHKTTYCQILIKVTNADL